MVLVVFSTFNLLLVYLISVMLDCCKDGSLKMSVFFVGSGENRRHSLVCLNLAADCAVIKFYN